MSLTFRSKELEAEFAAYFGFRCRVPSFLLSTFMALIWMTGLFSLQTRVIPFRVGLSSIFAIMAAVHSFNAVTILRNAAVCCSEKTKAKMLVLDALACMFTVVLFVERHELKISGNKPSLLLVSSPFVVYAIHGWSVPFAGFRFVADLFLHSLNVQIYVIMRIQQEWMRSSPIDYQSAAGRAFSAFCVCSIIPLMVNLFYEANVRSVYLTMRGLPHRQLGGFWLYILNYSYTDTLA